ncbi:hypothetical protein ACQY0O_004644 [Thecaphora frezii]
MSAFDSYIDDGTLAYRQQQRRKVNTCLQCKTRKVKCDKVRPHCGPCQRRRIPVDRCIWAEEADPEQLQQPSAAVGGGGGAEWPSSVYEHPTPPPAAPSSGSSLLGLSDTDARAVLERISRLEMRMRSAGPDFDSITPASNTIPSSAPPPAPARRIDAAIPAAGTSNARAALPAVVPTRQAPASTSTAQPQTQPSSAVAPRPATVPNPIEVISLIDDDDDASTGSETLSAGLSGVSPDAWFPFAAPTTKERFEAILASLPEDRAINGLLDGFRASETLVPLGISWRLFRVQLINLRGDIADWRNGYAEDAGVDHSFLALLFEVMAAAAECKSAQDLVRSGVATTAEQVPELIEEWHDSCRSLLAMSDLLDQPNLNLLTALSLFRLHPAKHGKVNAVCTYSHLCMTLARKLGIDSLGTARDDSIRWLASGEDADPTIRTGPVVAVRKAQFYEGDEYQAAEEAALLQRLLDQAGESDDALLRRGDEALETVLADRSHLVREAARMLWVQLQWQSSMCGEQAAATTTQRSSSRVTLQVEEAEVADGDSFELPAMAHASSGGPSAPSSFKIHGDLGRILSKLPPPPPPASPGATGRELEKWHDDLVALAPYPAADARASERSQAHACVAALTARWLALRELRRWLHHPRLASLARRDATTVVKAAQRLRSITAGVEAKMLAPWYDVALLQAGVVALLYPLLYPSAPEPAPEPDQDTAPPTLTHQVQSIVTLTSRTPSSLPLHANGTPNSTQTDPHRPRNGARLLHALLSLLTYRQQRRIAIKRENQDDDVPMLLDPSFEDDIEPKPPEMLQHDPVAPYFEALRRLPDDQERDDAAAKARRAVRKAGFWILLDGIV